MGYFYFGMLSTQPFPNGNQVSATAQYIVHLKRRSIRYRELLDALLECEKMSGCWSRYPNQMENTSVDDYLSAAACDPQVAERIHSYGEKTGWNFDIFHGPMEAQRGLKQWLGRFLGFVAHVEYARFSEPNLIFRAAWAASVWIAARKPVSNQDGWMQSHLMILTYENQKKRSLLCDRAVQYWRSKKPVPMREIVASYIGTKDHPLVDVWDD